MTDARIRVLRIYGRNIQQTAIVFVDYVLSKLPFKVECIQTDNGSLPPQFHWHLLDKGIQHHYSGRIRLAVSPTYRLRPIGGNLSPKGCTTGTVRGV